MAIKICLDAGHYGKYNQSPAVKTYYESDMNWKLHLLLKAELESYGIEVITTRSNKDVDLGLLDRGKKSKGCDLFISIHSNAVGSNVNESVDYPVVYVPISGKANAIGEKLADCVTKVMGTKQKGYAKQRKGSGDWDYYSVIHGAVSVGVAGVIIEHSFHTNTRATNWLLDDSNLAKMAKAEAEVIAAHYGLQKQKEEPAVKPAETVSTPKNIALRTLQKGAKGEDVMALQILLRGRGCNGNMYQVLDGIFGNNTLGAVKLFQEKNGLDVDGIVGVLTWSKLLGV